MKLFPHGHATHRQWQMAAGLVLAQVRAQMALPEYASSPTLALLYITDHYASSAQDILEHLSAELPEITDWSGTVGVGVVANQVEYLDEPALVLMLCELPPDQYRVFSGVAPLGLGFEAHSALIHADGGTHDLPELLQEMAERTASGYLFGGLSSSRSASVQFAVGGNGNISGQGAASGVFSGGLSGVAFGEGVNLVSRVTQGCQPVSKARKVTQAERRRDALGALQWLAAQPQVDARRLALLGWSNGGSTVLATTNLAHALVRGADVQPRFAAAFYPGCEAESQRGYRPVSDTLLLVGQLDDWTAAEPCQRLARDGPPRVTVLTYEGAYHGFDGSAPLRLRSDVPNGVHPGQGVHVGGQPAARAASQAALVQALQAAFAKP